MAVKLSVNVNKIATLRNARGGSEPSVALFARRALQFGAHGITVHPRPDERHIRASDVHVLGKMLQENEFQGREFNIEGYPDDRYLNLVEEVRPTQATLVPDGPDVLTSNAGWDVVGQRAMLQGVVARIQAMGVRVSLFVDPEVSQVRAAKDVGADRIELYTGPYAEAFAHGETEASYDRYVKAASCAVDVGVGVNAGHDLDVENLWLIKDLPGIEEVSIGHALVCHALVVGWEAAIKAYLDVLSPVS